MEKTKVGNAEHSGNGTGQGWWWLGAGTISLASVAAYTLYRKRRTLSACQPTAAVENVSASEPDSAQLPPPKQPVFPVSLAKEREHTVLVSAVPRAPLPCVLSASH